MIESRRTDIWFGNGRCPVGTSKDDQIMVNLFFGVDEYGADEAEGGNGDDNDEDYNGGIAIKCR